MTVIDSHTGGEPFRLVIDGLPEIPGETVLAKRRYAIDHLDDLRRMLMWEPRGHADMYGGWLGDPVEDDSDLSILFLHNQGFSTMCGHGIIALATIVFETGIIEVSDGTAILRIDTPAGQVSAWATVMNGSVGEVRFRNVASFVDSLDNSVDVPGIGDVGYDLAFGGAYYAYVDAASIGLSWPPRGQTDLVEAGRRIKESIMDKTSIRHPEHLDLGFLYGVIFTGAPSDPQNHYRNICVFADGEVDRSPTGTGVSGRVAIDVARRRLSLGESIRVESIIGSVFTGLVAGEIAYFGLSAVLPEISGTAHIMGRSTFWLDPDDPIRPGFILR